MEQYDKSKWKFNSDGRPITYFSIPYKNPWITGEKYQLQVRVHRTFWQWLKGYPKFQLIAEFDTYQELYNFYARWYNIHCKFSPVYLPYHIPDGYQLTWDEEKEAFMPQLKDL